MNIVCDPLHLDTPTFRTLLQLQGPSLGLWRAAEVAALREQTYEPPALDLGCGDGLVTSLALSQVEIGLDPDQRAIAQAARRGVYQRFEVTPAEESHLPDESIGTVVSNSVLEHLPRLDDALRTTARMLRPGGKLVFTAPTDVFSTWLFLPLAGYAAWRNRQLCHLNLWSIRQWVERLERVGLEVEVVRPYLRHRLVWAWDTLELLQHIWIGHRRLFGICWRYISPSQMDRLAVWASQLDLSSSLVASGGRLIVARKR